MKDEHWIDISHTVKVGTLKGGKLMKNILTGETMMYGENTTVAEVAPTPVRKPRKKKDSEGDK